MQKRKKTLIIGIILLSITCIFTLIVGFLYESLGRDSEAILIWLVSFLLFIFIIDSFLVFFLKKRNAINRSAGNNMRTNTLRVIFILLLIAMIGAMLLRTTFIKEKIANIYWSKADAFKNSSKYDKAIQYYKKALSIVSIDENTKYKGIYLRLGNTYVSAGRLGEAIDILKRYLALPPDEKYGIQGDIAAYFGLGTSYLLSDRLEDALEMADKCVELRDNHNAGYGLRGQIFARQKEYAKAKAEFEKALELAGNDETDIDRQRIQRALKKLENTRVRSQGDTS